MMDLLKAKLILMFFGAISISILGIKNFYTTASVPAITELQRISGEIYEYSCKKNSKYGDHITFKLIGDSVDIIMSRISINCNVLIPELKKNKFKIDVWVDTNASLPLGYAMLIDKKFYQSYMLGITDDKEINIVSLIMIFVGFTLMMKVFHKKDQSLRYLHK